MCHSEPAITTDMKTARELLLAMIDALDRDDQKAYAEAFEQLKARHSEAYQRARKRQERTTPHP